MDQRQAIEALTRADELRREMARRADQVALVCGVLGVVTIAMVLTIGLASGETALWTPAYLVAIFALISMNWYAYSRPVALRHHLTVHYILTGAGVAFFALTVTTGPALFPDSTLWWTAGAALCGVPFFLAAVFNMVGVRKAQG
ncbi:hypothetical protein HNR23_002469 [Nocardiopsis mwathae]|uniref:Uncharacterized protein n=1 Tax=Nocardiopsis mwathae TaxID=1472723 RepID=A0A7W9YHW9_9ACTN|nr:hypothetical protein [Nocardiopsis mwathae]MBB6172409.1 hypothetical protein [Nocardiopsis mwathae]